MPYICITIWYPSDIVQEVTERYFEMLKKYPFDRSLGKETIPVAVTTSKRGINSMSVMETKRENLGAAMKWVGDRMILFQDIKGLEYQTRIWSTIGEALEAVGISPPGQ
ncbi:MAG: hypothetical protein KGD67_02610 [Candidatus Lokiarchaeota archaeon]|nr:hypothetical protein [Candidatus Lokiarchaeota archaeon]